MLTEIQNCCLDDQRKSEKQYPTLCGRLTSPFLGLHSEIVSVGTAKLCRLEIDYDVTSKSGQSCLKSKSRNLGLETHQGLDLDYSLTFITMNILKTLPMVTDLD